MWPGYEARKNGVAWSVLHRLLRDDILGKKFAEFKYCTLVCRQLPAYPYIRMLLKPLFYSGVA